MNRGWAVVSLILGVAACGADGGEQDAQTADASTADGAASGDDASGADAMVAGPSLGSLRIVNTYGPFADEIETCVSTAGLPMVDRDGRVSFVSTPTAMDARYTCTLSGPTSRPPVTCRYLDACNCLPGTLLGYVFEDLMDGEYSLTVRAEEGGTAIERSLSFVVDNRPPMLAVVPIHPSYPSTVPLFETAPGVFGDGTFRFRVLGESATAAAQIHCADSMGAAVPCPTVPLPQPGELEASVAIAGSSPEGNRFMAVTASDCLGNAATRNLFPRIDKSGPRAAVTPRVTSTSPGAVRIQVSMLDLSNVETFTCNVDGTVFPCTSLTGLPSVSQGWVTYLDVSGLSPGSHQLNTTATDFWGHSATDTHRFDVP